MSYPRAASSHPQINGQINGQTADQPSRLPVRSRVSAAPHAIKNNLQNKLTPNLQLSRYPNQHFTATQPISQADARKASRAVWIGVGMIALSLFAVVPAHVGSKSIDLSSCEKKVKPTGEISRGQMSSLLALPAGSNKEAVRQVVDEPYCTLSAIAGAEREAYPLAFDPEAWVIVTYSQTEEYAGYDFVFKP